MFTSLNSPALNRKPLKWENLNKLHIIYIEKIRSLSYDNNNYYINMFVSSYP